MIYFLGILYFDYIILSKSKCAKPMEVLDISFSEADTRIGPESFALFYVCFQIAISASNTGGAWDNAKKYIEVMIWRNAL